MLLGVTELGAITPPPDVVRRLAQIDDRLALDMVPVFGDQLFGVFMRWPEGDPNWAKVQNGELDPKHARDLLGTIPSDCPVEAIPGYLERILRQATPEHARAAAARVARFNDAVTDAAFDAAGFDEAKNVVELRGADVLTPTGPGRSRKRVYQSGTGAR